MTSQLRIHGTFTAVTIDGCTASVAGTTSSTVDTDGFIPITALIRAHPAWTITSGGLLTAVTMPVILCDGLASACRWGHPTTVLVRCDADITVRMLYKTWRNKPSRVLRSYSVPSTVRAHSAHAVVEARFGPTNQSPFTVRITNPTDGDETVD